MISIDVDLSELPALLARQVKELEQLDFTDANRAAAVVVRNHLVAGMKKGVSPDGTPFLPLKRPRRGKGGKLKPFQQPLWDSGRLANSLGAGMGHVERVSSLGLVIGTNVSYAPYHQSGTETIPARPFIGISDECQEELDELYAGFLERALGG
jgi:phage gpG-like protein